MHPQPQKADALQNRCQRPTQRGNLRGQKIRLLAAHPLCGAPAQPQHKGRNPGFCNNLFQKLAYWDFTVQNRRVAADDLDTHIAYRHKIPDAASPGIAHSPAPLLRQHPASLRRANSVSTGAGHGKPHVSAPLPIDADGVVNLHQHIGQKRKRPQQGNPVGAVRLWIQRRKQQQLLAGELRHSSALVRSAEGKVQRADALFDLNVLHPPAQQRRDIPVPQRWHNLSHRLSTG